MLEVSKPEDHITVGLIGNPNVGKSTLFNTLTGAHQKVGNWLGKTIEKKGGFFFYKNHKINVVDLPGAYSLSAYTEEEDIASEFVLEKRPDVVIQIADAENLERNLYLTVQLLELGAPVVLAINMVARAKKQNISIDEKKLSRLLNIPVVKIEAHKNETLKELMSTIIIESHNKSSEPKIKLGYGKDVNEELEKIKKFLKESDYHYLGNNLHWLALKVLENDERIFKNIKDRNHYQILKKTAKKSTRYLYDIYQKDIIAIISEKRYDFIRGICQEVLNQEKLKANLSDRIDKLITHKYLGLLIFFFVMLIIFQATFTLANPLADAINNLMAWFGEKSSAWFQNISAPIWLGSLVTNGVIGGVGAVLSFIPNIFMLFLMLGILEDTGYLARVAFVMDRFMHKMGLHGKSFIPLILGFGCNVPAVMASRTLEAKKDRILTILITPLMSCSARLPIYILFAGVFFKAYQGLVIFSLYLLGIVLAVLIALLFKKLFFKGLSDPFVIELPPYRKPLVWGLLLHVWLKVKMFIKRAGTIILVFSLVIWFLASLPLGVAYASSDSFAGKIGSGITPIFEPLGFGQWEASVALIFGAVAKEVVVGTFGALYGASEASLSDSISLNFTPLGAYSFMIFSLIYIPCLATVAVIKKETGSGKWTALTITYSLALGWLVSFLVFQGGRLLNFS